MKKFFTCFVSVFMVIVNTFLNWFSLAQIPSGKKLDMTKFDPVPAFADEFDGDSVNWDNWTGHYCYGGETVVRRGGYWNREMASVHDGNLVITTQYMPEGIDGSPAGWYSYGLDTNYGGYEQQYGYFEVRCILPKGTGLWGAFWMLTDSMFEVTGNGLNGAEIDIFESPYYCKKGNQKNAILQTVHFDGYNEAHQQRTLGKWRVSGNPYEEYHTYGLEWNEKEYIFYIDGVMTKKSTFGGASRVPQYMILSVEVGGAKVDGVAVPGDSWAGNIEDNDKETFKSEFIIDYVRAYQYKVQPD